MTESLLLPALQTFARAARQLSDSTLDQENWHWLDYDGVRFAFLLTYQQLRELAARTAEARATHGPAITAAQRIQAQHHIAYRDLWGVLAGVGDDEIDRPPAEGEWPLRQVLQHIIQAEQGFSILIRYALERHRAGDNGPADIPRSYWEQQAGDRNFQQGTLDQILGRYENLHQRIVQEFSGLSDQELDWPSSFWESREFPLRFRLHRFDAHLCEHTIQLEKTLAGIGHPPSEAERLLRQLFLAFGEAEGQAIGAEPQFADSQRALAAEIVARAQEITSI